MPEKKTGVLSNMLFFIGFISLLQILFLPGFVLARFFGIKDPIPTLVLSFPLSLAANYLFVFSASGLGLFNRAGSFMYVSAGMFFVVFFLWKSEGIRMVHSGSVESARKGWVKTVSRVFLLLLLLATLLPLLSKMVADNPGVLDSHDAAASFNRWAVEWYHKGSPTFTSTYPQLIPTNWALMYQLAGTSNIQVFAKGLMPFFSLYTLVMLLHLHACTRHWGAGLVSAVFYCWLLYSLHGSFITAGYVDIPVTFKIGRAHV